MGITATDNATPPSSVTVYNWDIGATWVSDVTAEVMFSAVPPGTYEFRLTFGSELSTMQNSCTLIFAGTTYSFGFGRSADNVSNHYSERVLYITTTTTGDWTIQAPASTGNGGMLRAHATMRTI